MTIPNSNAVRPEREKKISIMIVNDKQADIHTLMKILDSPEFDLKPTASPDFALRSATAYPPDLILLAIEVRGKEGEKIFEKFQADTATASIPVIFTGTPSALKEKTTGIPSEYINCIHYPFKPDEVIEKIQSCLSANGKQIKITTAAGPLSSHESRPAAADDSTSAGDARNRYTILVVDDQEILLDLMLESLTMLGYRVKKAGSGPRALEVFYDAPETIDLVITDQTMPEMTGLELAAKIHMLRPQVPVILFSGYDQDNKAAAGLAEHISVFLQKPVLQQDLATAVKECLKKGHVPSQAN